MTKATATKATPGAERVALGQELGFYAAMSDSAVTADELARRTNTAVGFVAGWLSEQARYGFLTRDAASGRYATFCGWPRGN